MTHDVSAYFLRATGQRSLRAIALPAGMDPSTLGRQLTGKSALSVETVVALCRTHHLDMADAFVAAGFITEEEAQRLGAHVSLTAFADLELAREIVRRIEEGEATEALTGDLPTGENDHATVVELRPSVGGVSKDRDMLAAASESANTRPDDRSDEEFLQ